MVGQRRWRTVGVVAAVAAVGLAALGALGLAVDQGWIVLHDPPESEFPIRGLDVSHHQGPIDWAAVAGTGRYRFVWIKATEGRDWTDPRFAENWRGATEAGLDVGAYHYFTLCSDGSDQADHFLRTVPPGPWRLPLAIDLEHAGNCGDPPEPDAVRAEIRAFVDTIEDRTGQKPVVYTTRDFHRTVLGGSVGDCALWLRDVFRRPPVAIDGWSWEVWQHLSRGRVAGIDGFVDQNVFRGDEEDYERFRAGRPAAAAQGGQAPTGTQVSGSISETRSSPR